MVKVKTPTDLWMAKNLSDMKLWFLSESEYFISIFISVGAWLLSVCCMCYMCVV